MKTVCFGELLLRLSPLSKKRFVQADNFEINFGGAEANIAVALANFGIHSVYVTEVPEHDIGQMGINSLRKVGVDTDKIVRKGERLGIYYLENGASQRSSKVIYDRKHSSITTAKREDFDWDEIFDGADWFNITGITPALGDSVVEITLDALKVAKKKNITVSCDLNFRSKLWSGEKAGKVMSEIMQYVDICIANEEHADILFGIKSDCADDAMRDKDIAGKLIDKFSLKEVIITSRRTLSSEVNDIWASVYNGKDFALSKKYRINIVDRVGGGDALCAGFIYATLNKFSLQEKIDFAVASSAFKHSVEGDYTYAGVQEILAVANGDGTGRIQR